MITELDFNLGSPVDFSANITYWLGIGLSAGGSGPAWNAVVPVSGISAESLSGNFSDWFLDAQTDAFALYDTTFQISAPEPDSAWMLLGGIGLARVLYRYRRP